MQARPQAMHIGVPSVRLVSKREVPESNFHCRIWLDMTTGKQFCAGIRQGPVAIYHNIQYSTFQRLHRDQGSLN